MEENNKEIQEAVGKKKSKVVFIILGIIIILGLAFLVYFYFIKDNKTESNNNNNNNTNETENNSNEEVAMNKKVEKLLDEELPFDWTDFVNSNLYSNKLIKYEDLSENSVVELMLYYMTRQKLYIDIDTLNLNEEELIEIMGENKAAQVLDAYSIFPVSDIEDMIKEKYNIEEYNLKDVKTIESFEDYYTIDMTCSRGIVYNGHLFLYYGCGFPGYDHFTLDYTYDETDDELYVYEKEVLINFWEYNNTDSENGEMSCYNSQLDKKGINKVSLDGYELEDDGIMLSEDQIGEICANYAKTYKHTFKKNTSGDYYWYSTEPYEE